MPAALDLFRAGAWVPVSTVPNVHPPGLMAFLTGFWTLFGYSIAGTRVAMLLVAAGGALACFLLAIELSRHSTGTPAFTALAFLCISPLFFAQSMLTQLDMPAMALTILALLLFLQHHVRAAAAACVALVLVKETGIVLPLLLGAWLIWERPGTRRTLAAAWFLAPPAVLAAWLVVLHHATGSWFGNHAFESYNLYYPLRPDRLLLSLLRRLYFLFVSSGHLIGTLAVVWAWRRMPLFRDRAWRVAGSFAAAHVLVVTALGGAVLERYLLPVLPILYIAFAVAIRALLPRLRLLAVAGLAVSLAAANFVNPIYPFPFEDNLAFVSFVQLERSAVAAAEYTGGYVASAFPISNGLRNPDLGYVENPPQVIEMADFTRPEVEKLRRDPPGSLIVYNRTWDPLGLLRRPAVSSFLTEHYGYQPELSADEIGRTLHMYIARTWQRRGLTMQLLRSGEPPPGFDRTVL